MHKLKNKKLENKRGITLIALVITIIVLLILAGVSIATLTGPNGLLTQADEAKEKTKKAEVIERVKVDIQGYQIENKGEDITIAQLKNILSQYFQDVPEENELQEKLQEKDFKLKSKIEYGEQEIEILDIYKGSIAEGSGEATAEDVNAKIGQIVDYTDNSKGKVTSWRVFYASEEEMFLISSNTIKSSDAFGENTGIPINSKKGIEYTGAEDVFATAYGATYNSNWQKMNSIDTKERSKATAYMCDSENWTEYVGDDAPIGTYAVGGPTKELFIRSWVASKQTEEKLEQILSDNEVTADGYTWNKPDALYGSSDSLPIKKTILDGLYNNGKSYWLSSPCNNGDDGVCFINYDGNVGWNGRWVTACEVRPLVSIPMQKVKIEKGKVQIVYN